MCLKVPKHVFFCLLLGGSALTVPAIQAQEGSDKDSDTLAHLRPFQPRSKWCPPEPCPVTEIPKKPEVEIPKKPEVEPVLTPTTTAALGDTLVAMRTPSMIGDFFGYCAQRTITVTNFATTTTTIFGTFKTTNTKVTPFEQQVTVCDPIASRAGSGFKIADNASPRPQDRVYFTYNYFSGIQGQGGSVQPFSTGNTNPRVDIPGILVAGRQDNVHRELLGFEKTFFQGDASLEMRLPIFQTQGDGLFTGDGIGDMSIGLRFALINNRDTGNVFSAGLMMTVPTGPDIDTNVGNINSTLLQPWLGGIYNLGDFYVHGFSSLVVPTNSNDVTLFFNDLGVGYFLFRGQGGGLINALVPTIEAHVTTPLENRNGEGVVHIPDIVTLTGGVHVGVGTNAWFTLGVVTPVTGPRPFEVEAFAHFNYLF